MSIDQIMEIFDDQNNLKFSIFMSTNEIENMMFEEYDDGFMSHPEIWNEEVTELFPLGTARGACRIAGLPKPDRCV